MQVTQEALDPCQVALTIEVEQDKVGAAADQAYREYAKYVNVPGFRRGKAPLSFIKQRISESEVRQRTAELLVDKAYGEAIKDKDITPYASPKLELVQLELKEKPFIFKAVIPLAPVVTPGKYTKIPVDKLTFEVTDDDVQRQIDTMLDRAAEYPAVNRSSANGDILVAKVQAIVEGENHPGEPRSTLIEIGGDNIPGFDKEVVGLSAGEQKTFDLTYPKDFKAEELAGKKVTFSLEVEAVREKQTPTADDAFAAKVTGGRVTNIDEFRAELRRDMVVELERSALRDAQYKLVDTILDDSEVLYPPVLVESEVEEDLAELQQRLDSQQTNLDSYLVTVNKTREQLIEELTETATRRVKMSLLLSEIGRKEELALTAEELEATIAARAAERNTTAAAHRAYLENRNELRPVANQAQTQKILDFLYGSAVVTVRAAGSDTETKPAKSVSKKSKAKEADESKPKAEAAAEKKPAARKAAKVKEAAQE